MKLINPNQENHSDELSLIGIFIGGGVAYLLRPGQLSLEQILNAIFTNKYCEHSLRIGFECVQRKIIDGQVVTTLEYIIIAMILGYIVGWAVGKAIKRKP